jgi:hypothetical protein
VQNRTLLFRLDGSNLLPIVTGKEKTIERTFYWRLFHQQNKKPSGKATGNTCKQKKGEFLFNLEDDPERRRI